MFTIHVVIPRKEDVEDFVMKISDYQYDINLSSGHFDIDAKSILGVLGLGVGKVLKLEANTEDPAILESLKKYIVNQ